MRAERTQEVSENEAGSAASVTKLDMPMSSKSKLWILIINPLEIINWCETDSNSDTSELQNMSSFVFYGRAVNTCTVVTWPHSHTTWWSHDRVVTWSSGERKHKKSLRETETEAKCFNQFFILNTFPLNQQLPQGRNFLPFRPGFLNLLMRWVKVFKESMFYICRFHCHDFVVTVWTIAAMNCSHFGLFWVLRETLQAIQLFYFGPLFCKHVLTSGNNNIVHKMLFFSG